MSILNTTKKMIHTHVRRDRYSTQTAHGTRNVPAAVISFRLNSIKQKHANIVRFAHIAPDQKRAD